LLHNVSNILVVQTNKSVFEDSVVGLGLRGGDVGMLAIDQTVISHFGLEPAMAECKKYLCTCRNVFKQMKFNPTVILSKVICGKRMTNILCFGLALQCKLK